MRVSEPDERNFMIFCQVEFDRMSLRKVAAEHGISPTRVQQVVAQVRKWYDACTPNWVQEISPARQPFVACRYHHDRMNHYLTQLMDAWRASQGEQTVRHDRQGAQCATTRRSCGDGRYLLQAARVSEKQIEAAVRLAKIAQKFPLPDAAVPPAAAPQTPTAEVANPCARNDEAAPVAAVAVPEARALSDDLPETYDDTADPLLPCDLPPVIGATPVRAKLESQLNRRQRRKLARQQHKPAPR